MADLASLVVRLEAETSKYQQGLDQATKKLQRFQKDMHSSFDDIAKALAAGFATDKLVEFTSHVIEQEDQLGKLAQQTGISTEALSQLQYAAKLSGVTDLTGSLSNLTRAAGEAAEGSQQQAAAFKALGVSVTDANGAIKPTEQLLGQVADAFASYADGAGKSAIAQMIFGQSGAALIPFLDEGASGIAQLRDEADKLGITISGPAAQAAARFDDDLTKLKAAAVGLADQAIARILPQLNAFTGQMVDAAKSSDTMAARAEGLADALKTLYSAGALVGGVLSAGAKTIAGEAAALTALLHGDFSGAKAAVEAAFEDIADTVKGTISTVDSTWTDGLDAQQNKTDQWTAAIKADWDGLAQHLKAQLPVPNLKLGQQQDAALKQLESFKAALDTQVQTFGLGKAAAIEYDLQFGKLAKDIQDAGPDAAHTAAQIDALAKALQQKMDGQALQQVDIQIQRLTGHTVEAADAAFDLQNKALKANLESTGDTAGLAKIDTYKTLNHAAAQYNDLQQQASDIEADLQARIQAIEAAQASGSETSLKAMADEDQARQDAIAQLDDIHGRLQQLASDGASPQLVEGAKRFQAQIDQIAAQTSPLAKQLHDDFVDAGTDAFTEFVTGAKSASDAFKDFANEVLADITKIEAKNLAESLFGGTGSGSFFGTLARALLGSFGGGSSVDTAAGGGELSLFASALSHHAAGGDVTAGVPAVVGEDGPEIFLPHSSGAIIPNNRLASGPTIVNNYAPGAFGSGADVAAIRAELDRRDAKIISNVKNDIYRGAWKPILQQGLA